MNSDSGILFRSHTLITVSLLVDVQTKNGLHMETDINRYYSRKENIKKFTRLRNSTSITGEVAFFPRQPTL